MTGTSRVMRIPTGHGARPRPCSAGRWNTDSSIPAIRPRPALRRFRLCRSPGEFHQSRIPISHAFRLRHSRAHDAQPILEHLDGQASPRGWQGALPFTYHVGPGPVRVKLHLKQEYAYRSIWNVIGKIPGTQYPNEWVIAGNHRDAWVYGAVDPVSGTIAMLETVHGIGELLRAGWRPKRTVIIASWDAEEQGLIGSTEWAEEHEAELQSAVAYFNTDLGAYGPNFRASATPSLKRFVRDVTRSVPNPKGGTLYDSWSGSGRMNSPATSGGYDVALGDLGSGSDYTVFIDHLGIPATDVRSTGDYGVYHSAFDNYDWYRRFGDTDFLYSQELSRVFGLEILRMAGPMFCLTTMNRTATKSPAISRLPKEAATMRSANSRPAFLKSKPLRLVSRKQGACLRFKRQSARKRRNSTMYSCKPNDRCC